MTETIVIVSQTINECYVKIKSNKENSGLRSFGSPPCRNGFRDINSRDFQSADGLLPTPIKIFPLPVTNQSFSPKTPSPSVHETRCLKKYAKSVSVPIPIKVNADFNEMLYSERWAGPTYSNSPPPSSLPIPKFSSRPNRSVSLDLPSSSAPSFKFHSLAKSAPVSPSRDYNSPFSGMLCNSDESATETLRRMLNLDSADE